MIMSPGVLTISTPPALNQTLVWNLILQDGTNTDESEAVFKKYLTTLISTGVIP